MTETKRLAGKVALITGAGRGQGRSHAVVLAKDGADIVAQDLCADIGSVPYPLATPDELAETKALVEAEGQKCVTAQGDVRDLAHLRELVAQTKETFGRLDILIPNAGIMPALAPGDEDQGYYDAVDVMLNGVWNALRAAIPLMVEAGNGGSIVITSSTAGLSGLVTPNHAGSIGYAAAKHGVIGLMRCYANELAQHSIRVNTVHPTGVATPMIMNEAFGRFVTESPEYADLLQNALPVQLIEPIDVSNAIRWLVSDEARYVTGVQLPVDAGFLNRM
jgi:SDR family mycofactocin-dependent oxidoreductase